MFPALRLGIFFENFLIKFSSFFVKPVVPITTLFFNFDAMFNTSKVHLGTVKSIIKSDFLKETSELFSIFIRFIFLFTALLSVRTDILKFLSNFADLSIC